VVHIKTCIGAHRHGVTINRIGPHRATPDRVRTGPEMTDYFTSTTN